jgi:peptidoglycan/LPS O-acetylase OafA/YrhL
LAHRALLYLGTISYGIFLWHRPIINEAAKLGVDFGHSGGPAYVAWVLLALAGAAIVASLSWHVLERPILGLKRLVPDHARGAKPSPALTPSAHAHAEPPG